MLIVGVLIRGNIIWAPKKIRTGELKVLFGRLKILFGPLIKLFVRVLIFQKLDTFSIPKYVTCLNLTIKNIIFDQKY